ncbi:uncharacterized protein PV09_00480 [Verruconis gallopava]|uniref:Multicopper oxidase n=1 Tax=Verruconis gallopava TaxID=253628 RepID=A0A0D1Z9G7_9PEZI|nr:uncharacterized protein PV09_00480 [Verruconis gallopava]KIW09612.1 hypothetical protein PV09_00480 [Verruconis gallopava]
MAAIIDRSVPSSYERNNNAIRSQSIDLTSPRKARRSDGSSTSQVFGGGYSTNTSSEYPDTGVTRKYSFDVNYATIAPDGVSRQSILINGQFPGPTIVANYGDWIEVEVTNSLPDEGTTIHWHGMLQKESQWMDGVPSVQQCPLAPGKTFTYRFRADQVGTTWWHSHYSGQFTTGAYGALIINGNENSEYDEDIGPIFLSDWYHETLNQDLNTTIHSGNSQPPPVDNLLINGKMPFNCSKTTLPCTPNAPLSKFFFTPGKKYRLRLINSSAATNAKFSIDGHTFTVIAHDFTPLQPYKTDLISLANGQRADVIVEAIGAPGSSYWMRSDLGDGTNQRACIDAVTSPIRTAVAAVYYDGADTNSLPTTTSSIDPARLLPCSNDALNQTVPVKAVSSDIQGELTTVEMYINFTHLDNPSINSWTINGASYHADFSRALLSDVKSGNANSASDTFLYNFGSNGTVRLVLYNLFPFTHHPMHLHGFNFQVLAEGFGTWDGTITNPDNPTRRDVVVLDKAIFNPNGPATPAYTVIQFFTDNPGTWPFHCHMSWHNSAGLFSNLLIRPADVERLTIPDSITQICKDWNSWDSESGYEPIDSGI